MEGPVYVLLHSPLVGPLTWERVAQEMQQRGLQIRAPALIDQPGSPLPYWEQHIRSAAWLEGIPAEQKVVWVAHSGAGPLLPAFRQQSKHAASGYVFVDAGIPRSGASRLELMRLQDAAWAGEFQRSLRRGERFPTWSEEDLREVIPDEGLRRRMVAEIHPRALDFFTEALPVFSGWPDAPCAYVKFSPAYNWDYEQAQQAGWAVCELEGGHFHMLVDPRGVVDAILSFCNRI